MLKEVRINNGGKRVLNDEDVAVILREYKRISEEYRTKKNRDLLKLIKYNTTIMGVVRSKVKSSKLNLEWWTKDYVSKLLSRIRTGKDFYGLDLDTIAYLRSLEMTSTIGSKTSKTTEITTSDIFNKFTDRLYRRKDKTCKAMHEWFTCRDDVKGTDYEKVTYSKFNRSLHKYGYLDDRDPIRYNVRRYLLEKYDSLPFDKDGFRVMYYPEFNTDMHELTNAIIYLPRKDALERMKLKVMNHDRFIIEGIATNAAFKAYYITQDVKMLLEAFRLCHIQFNGYASIGQIATTVAKNYCRVCNLEYGDKYRRPIYNRTKSKEFKALFEEYCNAMDEK